jgi:hypothetical protein
MCSGMHTQTQYVLSVRITDTCLTALFYFYTAEFLCLATETALSAWFPSDHLSLALDVKCLFAGPFPLMQIMLLDFLIY